MFPPHHSRLPAIACKSTNFVGLKSTLPDARNLNCNRLVLGNRKRTISKPINLLISSCPRSVNLDLRNAIKTKCIYAIQRRANECPKMLEVYLPLSHNLVMGRKIQNQK